jgi:quercetin dioxygenase-like cupin family protein
MTNATTHAPAPAMALAAPAPIALGPGEGEALWAFGCLITVKASSETTGGAVDVLDHLAVRGAGSPLHVHSREDEWFYVVEGELTFWVGGRVIVAPAGAFVYGPRGVPHTFAVSSATARFLLVVQPGGFEGMLRELGEPAGALTVPPPPAGPPDVTAITRVCARYGIEVLGPPGIPG